MAFVSARIEGLGPVIGGFFSVGQIKIQDAMTLVEDSVENMKTPSKGERSATPAETASLVDATLSAQNVTANASDADVAAGSVAAKRAASTKGSQAAPQSMDEQDMEFL